MIVLSLNIRGLKSIPRQKAIKDLIGTHSLDFVCIQETKSSMDVMLQCASSICRQGH